MFSKNILKITDGLIPINEDLILDITTMAVYRNGKKETLYKNWYHITDKLRSYVIH